MATCGMIATTYSILAVPLSQEFKPSRMVLMLAMTVLSLVTGLVSPILGSLMDRVSMRLMTAFGVASVSLGYFALSFATSFNQVLVVFGVLMGPAQILLGPMAAMVLLSRWFVRRRGTALGISIAGIAVGGFVFPLVMQGLLDSFEWREAMRWLALVLVIVSVPAVLMIVDRPSDRGLHPDGAQSDPAVGRPAGELPAVSTRDILADPAFWLAGAIFAVVTAGMMGMITSLVPLATDEGIDADAAAVLISVYAACSFAAKLGFAVVGDRLHPRALLIISLLGFGVGAGCLIMAEAGFWLIAIGVSLVSLLGGLMVPLQSYLIPRIFGDHIVGKASGLLQMFILVVLLLTPPAFGLIFDLTGNYDGIFIIFAALAAGSLLLVPYLRLHPRDAEPELTELTDQPAAAE
jgi:MFS family permease